MKTGKPAPAPFSVRLKSLRREAGLTQAALAEAAGLSGQHVRAIEAGRRPDPGWSTVTALADALNVPVTAFR